MLLDLIITLLTTVMPESFLKPHKKMAVQPTDLKSQTQRNQTASQKLSPRCSP